MFSGNNHKQSKLLVSAEVSIKRLGGVGCDEGASNNTEKTYSLKNVVPNSDVLNLLAQTSFRDVGVHPLCDEDHCKIRKEKEQTAEW